MDAHQELVHRAGREVDAHRTNVDRHGADALDDVGIEVAAVGVGQVAEGLGVLEIAVHVRDEGDGDEPRLVVDDVLDGLHIGPPVLVSGDAQIEAVFLALRVVVERGRVGEVVGDDVVAGVFEAQAVHHDHLAVHRAGREADLRRLGVDQAGESGLDVVQPPAFGLVGGVGDHVIEIPVRGARRIHVERVVPRRVEVGLAFAQVEVSAQLGEISRGGLDAVGCRQSRGRCQARRLP